MYSNCNTNLYCIRLPNKQMRQGMLEEIKKYKEQKEQLRKLIVENDELYKQMQEWRNKK